MPLFLTYTNKCNNYRHYRLTVFRAHLEGFPWQWFPPGFEKIEGKKVKNVKQFWFPLGPKQISQVRLPLNRSEEGGEIFQNSFFPL